MSARIRILIAVVGFVSLVAISLVAIGSAAEPTRRAAHAGTPGAVTLDPGPRLIARSTARDTRDHLVAVAANDPGGPRTVADTSCVRVSAAGGTGICLRLGEGLRTFEAVVLGPDGTEQRALPLVGVPNRARVSPSGRLVTWTVFVTGDSYNGGRFATRVGILDTGSGDLISTLEDWAVSVDNRPYRAEDLNFWGVTFAPDDRYFYATMSTAGHRYLVHGDLSTRSIRTVRENVECPSLSPDGTRLAFKAAVAGDPNRGWRLSVLDLAGGRVTPLAETRSVDDQAAWIDDRTVAYGVRRGGGHADVWQVPADGSGAPSKLIPDADSPATLAGPVDPSSDRPAT
ncbi:PD40 domain-containing protein [Embleya hyalina]|uniref:TolB-like translocation protein signal peptide n=1 Tax=Embleya hyalina TaxID=516124 RepID=A0A401YEP0_9ACTN|nr:PD40 domain-containing protein [Embleya hyalina]GCD93037.1 TolB-like translocation protein; signal peptide [Embleya hyalina]